MKQHIDTIPVWDAYKSGCECPLCAIRAKNEDEYVDNFLGASVMEPDRRVEVNQKGFCDHHFQRLFGAGNRLGLALMTHTHMKESNQKLFAALERAKATAGEEAGKSFLTRKKGSLNDACAEIEALGHSCAMCERLDAAMERYIYTLLYMWKHETEFREAFAASKGLCVPHCAAVLKAAPEQLSGKDLNAFVDALVSTTKASLEKTEKDLEWFTLKFDYRNKDKPWGDSQDAVERSINRLRGRCV